jgi:hypothetical protein
MCSSLPSAASPLRVPSGRDTPHRAQPVKAVQVVEVWSGGTLVGARAESLDRLCYTGDPAREARMERRVHEGIL